MLLAKLLPAKQKVPDTLTVARSSPRGWQPVMFSNLRRGDTFLCNECRATSDTGWRPLEFTSMNTLRSDLKTMADGRYIGEVDPVEIFPGIWSKHFLSDGTREVVVLDRFDVDAFDRLLKKHQRVIVDHVKKSLVNRRINA